MSIYVFHHIVGGPTTEEIKIDPNTNLFKRYDFLKNPIMKKSF